MVKLGPLDSKTSYASERVLDRLITHFCLMVCVTTVVVAADVGVGAGNLADGEVADGTDEVLLLLELLVLMCLVGFEFWGCLLKATLLP